MIRVHILSSLARPGRPDLTGLPWTAIAKTMQTMAADQLTCLLAQRARREAGVPASPAAQAALAEKDGLATDLATRLSRDQARVIALPRPWMVQAIPVEHIVRRAVAGRLSAAAWQKHALAHVRERWGGLPPRHVPDALWPMLGEMAWLDPEWNRQVATTILNYLYHHALVPDGCVPVVGLSTPACWLLLALRPVPALTRRSSGRWGWLRVWERQPLSWLIARFRSWPTLRRRAMDRLRCEAERQAVYPGWTFWDQWLVSQIVAQWPASIQRLDPRLHAALLALPLLTITGQGAPETGGPALAAAGWEQAMPSWFQIQFDIFGRW